LHIHNNISFSTRKEEIMSADRQFDRRDLTLNNFMGLFGKAPGVDFARLRAGAVVEAKTCNTTYYFIAEGEGSLSVLVSSDGKFFHKETMAYLNGAGYGNGFLVAGTIKMGLPMEITSFEGEKVLTTEVNEIVVDEMKIAPDDGRDMN
jgi:hypothetical protein